MLDFPLGYIVLKLPLWSTSDNIQAIFFIFSLWYAKVNIIYKWCKLDKLALIIGGYLTRIF